MSTNFRSLRNIRKRPGAVPKEKEKYEAIEQALQKLARRDSSLPRGAGEFFEINPMKNYATRPGDLKKQPRCGARTRAGAPCRRPPVRGRKRCRLHGGLSPGAPRGLKNGNYKTGDWTSEAITERKWLRSLVHSFAKSGTTE